MAPESNVFAKTGSIEWARLGRAASFFEKLGYEYKEVPWAVSQDIVKATAPVEAKPFIVKGKDVDLVLVGSAEQGFVHAALDSQVSTGKLYYSVSPCFRGETAYIKGFLQPSFMKLELFALEQSPRKTARYQNLYPMLMRDAQLFMSSEGLPVVPVETSEGHDLTYEGSELGSYGRREWNLLQWAYGTGLAEPRFSSVYNSYSKDRERWMWNKEVVELP